jgi:hypothetical protein
LYNFSVKTNISPARYRYGNIKRITMEWLQWQPDGFAKSTNPKGQHNPTAVSAGPAVAVSTTVNLNPTPSQPAASTISQRICTARQQLQKTESHLPVVA